MAGNTRPIGGTFEDIGEAVVKPVTEEVGRFIETGVQSVFGAQPTNPIDLKRQQEQKAKKQQEDAKKRQNILQYINNLKSEEQVFRQKKQVEQSQKKQEEQQDKQVKQFKVEQKKRQIENQAIVAAKTKTETKRGVGG